MPICVPPSALAAAGLGHQEVTTLFLSVGVLLLAARSLGELARRFGQPAVLGELMAGILLGPTLLGRVLPDLLGGVFPSEGPVHTAFSGLTTVGIALFLLVAGLEVDLSTVWRQGRNALKIGFCGMSFPFAVGFAIAYVAPTWIGSEVPNPPLVFSLFVATAMTISALPVIAKILMDLNLFRSDLGMVVIAGAIIDDLTGWLIFALVLGMMSALPADAMMQGAPDAPVVAGVAETAAGEGVQFAVWQTALLTLTYVAGMLTIGRVLLDKVLPWSQAHLSWPGGVTGLALGMALLCAAFTEWIGVHGIFGAFIFGVALGDSRHLREQTRETLDRFISFFFAPLFFGSIGLRVDFLSNFDVGLVLIVLAVATVGKLLGCTLGARWGGFSLRESMAIGSAMNARGAMEIILALIALEAGLIGPRLFVALVVMALVTSIFAGTMMQRLLGLRKPLRFFEFLPASRFRPRLKAADRRQAVAELVRAAVDSVRATPANRLTVPTGSRVTRVDGSVRRDDDAPAPSEDESPVTLSHVPSHGAPHRDASRQASHASANGNVAAPVVAPVVAPATPRTPSAVPELDATQVERLVWKRERVMSSGLGNGLAVPHARVPGLKHPIVAVGLSPSGIDFDARDGRPARVICLLLSPGDSTRVQLDLLADLGRTFADPAFADKAAAVANHTEFLALIHAEGPRVGGH